MNDLNHLPDLDAWYAYGEKYLRTIDPKSSEYLPVLKRLQVIARRRVEHLEVRHFPTAPAGKIGKGRKS